MVNGPECAPHTLEEALSLWKQYNKSDQFANEFSKLLEENNKSVLEELFLYRLQFGTAGLRDKMGPGFSRINDVVIIQTTQGFVEALLKLNPDVRQKGAAVGYDGRHFSRRFAELTATVFINAGIPVHLFSACCPTPLVAYTINSLDLSAGVMVTASHNTKVYNGYKVYGSNGSQIISPYDKEIQKAILDNLKPRDSSWNTDVLKDSPLLSDPLATVRKSYCQRILSLMFDVEMNMKSKIKFVFTPLHGVSYPYVLELFDYIHLNSLIVVEQQKDPDPEFSTVVYPNPEEGDESFTLAFRTADEHNVNIVFANDPDADRLGVAEKDQRTGKWRIFTGNEVGALLGWWSIYVFKNKHSNQDCFPDAYVLSTTVSSRILKTIAEMEGIQYDETLTGFKWIGNRARELQREGKTVLFGFEEAIGYMCDSEATTEKDGISAMARLSELAVYLDMFGTTLAGKLQDIYCLYGYHIAETSYFICEDRNVREKIFDRLRNFKNSENGYPTSINGGRYKIVRVRDLSACYDSSTENKKPTLPCSKSPDNITFFFENGYTCTLRSSGTEPKLKYYVELQAAPGMSDVDVLKGIVWEMTDAIVKEFLQPDINGLLARDQQHA